jgi:hypothetical protein
LSNSELKTIHGELNKLSGTIPDTLFSLTSLDYLDLSNNKIEGTIPKVVISAKTVKLDSNRISGPISSDWFENTDVLNVLDGNHFDCFSQFPQQDPVFTGYICGSETTDISMSVYWSVFGIICLILISAFFLRAHLGFLIEDYLLYYFKEWNNLESVPNVKTFLIALQDNTMILFTVTSVLFLAQVIVFPSLKSEPMYSTQEYQYSLEFSAAFMSGLGPVTAMFIIGLIVLLYYAIAVFNCHTKWMLRSAFDRIQSCHPRRLSIFDSSLDLKSMFILISFTLLGDFVVILIYIGYVRLYYLCKNLTEVTILQFCFSILILVINRIALPIYVRFMSLHLNNVSAVASVSSAILLFGNIIAPIVSVAFTSTQCFRYAIDTLEQQSISFELQNCRVYDEELNCIESYDQIQSLSYNPQLLYNSTCRDQFFLLALPIQRYNLAFLLIYKILLYYIFTRNKEPRNYFPSALLEIYGSIYWPTIERGPPFLFIYDSESITMSQNYYVALVFTYGVISPAFLISVTLNAVLENVIQRILLFRFAILCKDSISLQVLDKSCTHATNYQYDFLTSVIANSSIFLALFLLDMGGDKNSFAENIWIPITYFIVICVLMLYFYYKDKQFVKNISKPSKRLGTNSGDFELPSVADDIAVENPILSDRNGDNTSTRDLSTLPTSSTSPTIPALS